MSRAGANKILEAIKACPDLTGGERTAIAVYVTEDYRVGGIAGDMIVGLPAEEREAYIYDLLAAVDKKAKATAEAARQSRTRYTLEYIQRSEKNPRNYALSAKVAQRPAVETVKALEAKKRPCIVLSDLDSDGWHFIRSEGGFTLDATTSWPDDLTERLIADQPSDSLADPPAFQWTEESEPDQKDRYVPHLAQHLQISRYREAALVPLAERETFLSVSDRRLRFDIKGTTDVAVLHKGFNATFAESQRVLAVIELTKECTAKAVRQTIVQLIAADLISYHSPLALLTDLREEWHFHWLEGRTIKMLRPPDGPNVRRDALLFMRLALAPGFLTGAELTAAYTFVAGLPVSVSKRRKL